VSLELVTDVVELVGRLIVETASALVIIDASSSRARPRRPAR
jgi:hypothetical protein